MTMVLLEKNNESTSYCDFELKWENTRKGGLLYCIQAENHTWHSN